MSPLILQPGRAYSFEYPRHNYRQLPTKTEPRRLVVDSIRDLVEKPIDQTTETLNPFLRRSRWLVTGTDLDKDGERSFYFESMTNIQALTANDLNPLADAEYVVVSQQRVTYQTQRLHDALDFRTRRKTGTICAVLTHGPRAIPTEIPDSWSDDLEQFRALMDEHR